MKEVVASLDIGSYTARMLVAKLLSEARDFVPLLRAREYINIADFYEKPGIIKEKAIENTVKVIDKFLKKAKEIGTNTFYPVGTGVIREAKNKVEFIVQVKKLTGIEIVVISGEKEAYLTAEGVIHSLKLRKDSSFVIIDIGGGSTEFFVNTNGSCVRSIPLGAATFQKVFKSHVSEGFSRVEELLNKHLGDLQLKADQLIGTGGTITSLVAVVHGITPDEICPENLNGKTLTLQQAERVFENLIHMSPEDMVDRFGLDKNRAKVIIPGTIILLSIMRFFGFSEITASLSDILEGIILKPDILKREI